MPRSDYAFKSVVSAKYIRDYRVWLEFNDGESGEVDLSEELWGEVFEPLKDQNYFKNFKVERRTIAWENEADLAPDFLYELLKTTKQNEK